MSAPPVGTVTFLFTDIEGSTRRWEHQQAAMQTALAHHDAILRTAIEAHGGVVFKTVGDAFYAAFATAPDALAAALAAQCALDTETWGELGPLRVRMALHTGAVEACAGDYFGPPLNRVARLLSAGHGGQTLLSGVSQELVRDDLPPNASLRDLGEHRLKDLIRPERIFQLVVPNLPSEFPPLKTLDVRPTNLPVQPTPLIGREREIATMGTLLRRGDVRLVTLTGPGGTGKTRLALQVAAELLDEYEHGVFFVNLAPISDPALVSSTIAQTLGVTEAGGQPIEATLKSYLHDKQLLLVLDNFEQVLRAAPLVAELLATAPQVKVIVTSRAVLHLRGEHEFAVPPLALPNPQRLPAVERLTQYDAVRLFIERAQAVKPDFYVTNTNAPAIAEICVRLDGLPLAIELAAARIKLLPPKALLQRLSNRLKLLTRGPGDLPARQQTLRNTIDWSYNLLEPAEQTLFARLAVLSGGRTLAAIEAVCNTDGDLRIDPLDGVASLVDKSLLRQEDGLDAEPRFIMLETIYEYAHERLEASGEAEVLRWRHAMYFLTLAEQAEPELRGPTQVTWLERLEHEHDNLRAALQFVVERGEIELGLRLSGALTTFWRLHGHISEGRQWFEEMLLRSSGTSIAARAKALKGQGGLAWVQGDLAAARSFFNKSLELYRDLEDRLSIAALLNNLGVVANDQGDNAAARLFFQESLQIKQQLKDTWGTALTLGNLGVIASYEEDFAAARTLFEESLLILRTLQDKRGITVTLCNLGNLACDQGDYKVAHSFFEESLLLLRALQDKNLIASSLHGLAYVAAAKGEAQRATQLCAAAAALRDSVGAVLPPREHRRYEHTVATTRAQLDEAAWDMVWNEGYAMSLEQAIAYALEHDAQT